jgi:hypothetical protein
MIVLGLRLSLAAGREGLARLAAITAAVAAGVAVLLAVLADIHAYSATNSRQCWECTHGAPGTGRSPGQAAGGAPGRAAGAELWNYSLDYYEGRSIERLDVAALGPRAPVVPGLRRMPGPGQYYASPAMARLLASVPRGQLGERYPGSPAGTIGQPGLSGPDELVIVVGYSPRELAAAAATTRVTAIAARPAVSSTANVYQYIFGIVAIILVFPLLILIGTATRLAAARREERFAAMRLVGATPQQVSVIASVDAVLGALAGTAAGIGLFLLLRPALAGIAVSGSRYFPDLVTPTAAEYAVMLIGVPAAAAAAAIWSLRRIQISPLGAARKATTRSAPRAWQALPLPVGLVIFIVPVLLAGGRQHPNAGLPAAFLGLILIMTGLVTGGSWLTMRAARLTARRARGVPGLLAARRIAADPAGAFRSVSGLVLAIFVGTAIAGVIPAAVSNMQSAGGGTLRHVLRVSFAATPPPSAVGAGGPAGSAGPGGPGQGQGPAGPRSGGPGSGGHAATPGGLLGPGAAAGLLARLRSVPGATVLPLYAGPAGGVTCAEASQCAVLNDIVSCPGLAHFAALGRCAPGVRDAEGPFGDLLSTDNMLNSQTGLPIIGPGSHGGTVLLGRLRLAAVLVRTSSPAMLERVRTLLSGYLQRAGSNSLPQTFGEVASARATLYTEVEQVALFVVALTLLVAGCSLAVAVVGGLVERKRPFTLLRLTGTPGSVLSRVVLLESALPLVLAAVAAAAAGLAAAVPVVRQLLGASVSAALPGRTYFLTVGGGLLAALAVVLTALPLLRRVTDPAGARFE